MDQPTERPIELLVVAKGQADHPVCVLCMKNMLSSFVLFKETPVSHFIGVDTGYVPTSNYSSHCLKKMAQNRGNICAKHVFTRLN